MYNINQIVLQEYGKIVEGGLTCEELVKQVNHTTECVIDLFSFVELEWLF